MIFLFEYNQGIREGYTALVEGNSEYDAIRTLRSDKLLSICDSVECLDTFDEVIKENSEDDIAY